MQFLRSILFTACFFLLTTIYGVAELCAGSWLGHKARWAIAHNWAKVNLALLKWICRLKFEISGTEHIIPGANISMWKHSSTWETIAQAYILPQQVWVFKRELLHIPIVGWALRLMRPIAINREGGGSALRQVIAQGKERLAQGLWVVVFPEGTRMPVGQTRRYGLSAALLASETGTPVVPVAHTAGYFWPRRGWLKKPGTIKVIIGTPIETTGRTPQQINEEVQAWIEQTIKVNAPT